MYDTAIYIGRFQPVHAGHLALLRRALEKREAGELRSRFLPMETTYPALARWIGRVENLPGYDRTYPPHWREGAPRG